MPKTQSVLKRVLGAFKRLLRDVDDSMYWIYSPTVKYIEIYSSRYSACMCSRPTRPIAVMRQGI